MVTEIRNIVVSEKGVHVQHCGAGDGACRLASRGVFAAVARVRGDLSRAIAGYASIQLIR